MNDPLERPQEVHTRFNKSNYCRVIHADGVWGGVTPESNIFMALFSEHWALPDGTVIRPQDGRLVDVPEGVVPNRLSREIEAEVIISEQLAVFLRRWLDERLAELDELRRAQASQTSGEGV